MQPVRAVLTATMDGARSMDTALVLSQDESQAPSVHHAQCYVPWLNAAW